jgi:hypothetical protein
VLTAGSQVSPVPMTSAVVSCRDDTASSISGLIVGSHCVTLVGY